MHTNDVHCQVDQSPSVGEGSPQGLAKFGYAALAGYVAQLRETYANVTLVDAGDAVQGAPPLPGFLYACAPHRPSVLFGGL